MRRAIAMGILLACCLPVAAAELRPFRASYEVVWKGITAGRSELHLERLPNGEWAYSSRSKARGVFRVALPDDIDQRSIFVIRNLQVQPLRFHIDDGDEARKRDTDLVFDWNSSRVTGTADTRTVDMALEPGMQDAMSIQVSLMVALLHGQTPDRFQMIDGDKVKDYLYTREGEQTVETALGPQKTLIFRSSRPGNARGTWFWCAPDLGYLPVKVERRNGQKVEWSMTMKTANIDAGG